MLSSSKLRVLLRWVHIFIGLMLLCYVYSPLGANITFQISIKFLLTPVLVISGIWLWKFNAFNKFLGIK